MAAVSNSDMTAAGGQSTSIGRFTIQPDSRTAIYVPLGKELLIGRDPERCQLVFDNPQVSNHHLKIYSIIHDLEGKSGIKPLVYAEDLSTNGTYWNGSLMGNNNGGFLLRDGDQLQIHPKVILTYQVEVTDNDDWDWDDVQAKEMRHFRSSYEVSKNKLGAGVHGQVYMAVNQTLRRQLACKVVDLRRVRAEQKGKVQSSYTFKNAQIKYGSTSSTLNAMAIVQKRAIERKVTEVKMKQLREVEILKDLIHPNIIRLEKVYITDNTLYIFEELISGGDLFSYLESKGGSLVEIEAAVIVRQLLKALTFLHAQGIVHRDLKPDNVLMTSPLDTARVVLSDFGSAVQFTTAESHTRGVQRMESRVGTWDYLAPEVIGKNPLVTARGYTKAIDLWSLGCVTAALLTGATPFVPSEPQSHTDRRPSYAVIVDAAFACDLTKLNTSEAWRHVGPQAKSFIRGLLVLDETSRLTADEALNHLWYRCLEEDFENVYNFSIRHWTPRKPIVNIIEETQKSARKITNGVTRPKAIRAKNYKPIEAHYKPAHRHIDQLLSPARTHPALPPVTEVREKPTKVADAMESLSGSVLWTRGQPLPWKGPGGNISLSDDNKLVRPNILTETGTKGNNGPQHENTCSTMDIDEVLDTPRKVQLKCSSLREKPYAVPEKRKLGREFLFGEDQENKEGGFKIIIQSGKKKSMRLFHETQVHFSFESDPGQSSTPLRSMRQREPIQLHPYAIEAERYRQTLGSQTTTPLRVGQSELKKNTSGGLRNPLRSSRVEIETNRFDERNSQQQMTEEETRSQVFIDDAEFESIRPPPVEVESSVAEIDNVGTFFTPINRRQSIRLGDEENGRLLRRSSDPEDGHDGPLFSKKIAGISIRSPIMGGNYFSFTDPIVPGTNNTPPQAVTNSSNNILMGNIPETPIIRPRYSIFDYDEDELYTNTSIAKSGFRSARSFGRRVERRRNEKRAADLSDSIRTAYQ